MSNYFFTLNGIIDFSLIYFEKNYCIEIKKFRGYIIILFIVKWKKLTVNNCLLIFSIFQTHNQK
jgi:hypothetical protein